MYIIVEFKEADGGGIAIVNSSWLTPRKQEVFWPPVKEQKDYNKLLQSTEEIDVKNWKLYSVERYYYETDDYEKAIKKLKVCEISSDLQSDTDNLVTKRRRIPRKRLYLISSDDDEDYHSKPPRLRNTTLKEDSIDDIVLSANDELRKDDFRVKNNNSVSGKNTPVSSIEEEKLERHLEEALFPKKVLNLLMYIKEQNTLIIALLKEKVSHPTGCIELPVNLPLQNENDLNCLENFITEKENLNNLSCRLSGIGGRDTASKANRILKYLLKDSLATNYNFYGKRSQKRAFCDLYIRKAIVDAVKSNSVHATDKEVEDYIKVWLKHAPERLKKINY